MASRVDELWMAPGWWTLDFSTLPDSIFQKLDYFAEIYITPSYVGPEFQTKAELQGLAQFTGVLWERTRNLESRAVTLGGPSNSAWLGANNAGDLYTVALNFEDATFDTVVNALIPTALTAGNIDTPSGAALYNGRAAFMDTPDNALRRFLDLYEAEFRVNPDGTIDVGTPTDLGLVVTPTAIVQSRDLVGSAGILDPDFTAIVPTDLQMSENVREFASEILITGQGAGESIILGTATASGIAYKDPKGNDLAWKRLLNEPILSIDNADALAQVRVDEAAVIRQVVTLGLDKYIVTGDYQVGDKIYVYSPPDIQDPEVTARSFGQILHPKAIRVVGTNWPVTEGMGVYFRDHSDNIYDLTPFVKWESQKTASIKVGNLPLPAFSYNLANTTVLGRVTTNPEGWSYLQYGFSLPATNAGGNFFTLYPGGQTYQWVEDMYLEFLRSITSTSLNLAEDWSGSGLILSANGDSLMSAEHSSPPKYDLIDGLGYLRAIEYAGNTVTTPHADIGALTGDIDIGIDFALDDYTPGVTQVIFDKLIGNSGIKLEHLTTDKLRLTIGDGTGTDELDSTVVTGATDGARHTFRVIWFDAARALFTVDGLQLGAQVNSTRVLADSGGEAALGLMTGKVIAALIQKDGVPVAFPSFGTAWLNEESPQIDLLGNTWTVNEAFEAGYRKEVSRIVKRPHIWWPDTISLPQYFFGDGLPGDPLEWTTSESFTLLVACRLWSTGSDQWFLVKTDGAHPVTLKFTDSTSKVSAKMVSDSGSPEVTHSAALTPGGAPIVVALVRDTSADTLGVAIDADIETTSDTTTSPVGDPGGYFECDLQRAEFYGMAVIPSALSATDLAKMSQGGWRLAPTP